MALVEGAEPVPRSWHPSLPGLGASSQPQGSRDPADLLHVLPLTGVSWVAGLLWVLGCPGCLRCSPHRCSRFCSFPKGPGSAPEKEMCLSPTLKPAAATASEPRVNLVQNHELTVFLQEQERSMSQRARVDNREGWGLQQTVEVLLCLPPLLCFFVPLNKCLGPQ